MKTMYVLVVFVCVLAAGCQKKRVQERVQFIETVGKFDIKGGDDKIVVTAEDDGRIQFRIRGAGPAEPGINKGAAWFIGVVSYDSIWVHQGEGSLWHYSREPLLSKVTFTGWQYPMIGTNILPGEVEERIKASLSKAPSN